MNIGESVFETVLLAERIQGMISWLQVFETEFKCDRTLRKASNEKDLVRRE